MIRISIFLCLITLFCGIGCDSESAKSDVSYASQSPAYVSSSATSSEATFAMADIGDMTAGMGFQETDQNGDFPTLERTESESSSNENANMSRSSTPSLRRIIFNSNIELSVSEFDGTQSKVSALIRRHGGFIAEAKIENRKGRAQSGRWMIRVPVLSYRKLMDSMGDLGEIVSRNEKAKDVTAEFYDLEARIKNKEQLESRIVKLLENAKGDLKKLIEVERELGRVREEVERMQGQLRYLAEVTSMSTVELHVFEKSKKPEPALAASFSSRISDAWDQATSQAKITAENFAVAAVQNIFRIVLTGVVLLVAYAFVRRLVRNTGEPNVSTNPSRS